MDKKFIAVSLVVTLFLIGLVNPAISAAAEKASDAIIGSTFKTLAKAFIATADIDKLKQINVYKLAKKDDAKFRTQYAKIYLVLKQCPAIVSKYGLTEDLTKKQAIEKLKSLNKEDMYWALKSVPNRVIADEFRKYILDEKQALKNSNVVEKVKQVWNRMIEKAYFVKPPETQSAESQAESNKGGAIAAIKQLWKKITEKEGGE